MKGGADAPPFFLYLCVWINYVQDPIVGLDLLNRTVAHETDVGCWAVGCALC